MVQSRSIGPRSSPKLVVGTVIGPESGLMDTLDRANATPVAHGSAPGPLVQGGEVSAAALAARLGRWAHGDGTLSTRLAAGIAALIGSGELRPADRLPAERALAAVVAVSRGTVVSAYASLAEQGLVERRQGSGTRVSGARTAPLAVHFRNMGTPTPSTLRADPASTAPGPPDQTET